MIPVASRFVLVAITLPFSRVVVPLAPVAVAEVEVAVTVLFLRVCDELPAPVALPLVVVAVMVQFSVVKFAPCVAKAEPDVFIAMTTLSVSVTSVYEFPDMPYVEFEPVVLSALMSALAIFIVVLFDFPSVLPYAPSPTIADHALRIMPPVIFRVLPFVLRIVR